MADPITLQELKEASVDAQAYDLVVNGGPGDSVVNRAGNTLPSVEKFFAEREQQITDATARVFFTTADKMVASVGTHDKLALVHSDPDPVLNGQYFWDDTEEPAYGWRKTLLQPSSKEITDMLAESVQTAQETAEEAGQAAQQAQEKADELSSDTAPIKAFVDPQIPHSEYYERVDGDGGNIITDEDDNVLAETTADGIPIHYQRLELPGGVLLTNATYRDQEVEYLPSEEYSQSGYITAVVTEDFAILTGVSDKGEADQEFILKSGATGIGPLSLAAPAVVPGGVPRLDQVQSLIAGASSSSKIRAGTPTIAVIGDSRTAPSFISGTGVNVGTLSQPQSYPFWLDLLSGGALRCVGAWNFGVAGETSAQILARISSATGTLADIVVILASVNDGNIDSIGNVRAMADAVVAAGKIACVIAELPRDEDGTWTTVRIQLHQQTSIGLVRMSRLAGVRVANPFPLLMNKATMISWQAGYSYDGLHLRCSAAMVVGQAVLDALKEFSVTPAQLLMTSLDAYDATRYRTGNHVVNGLMSGTGGSLAGTATGSVATSWTLSATSGMTATGSKVVIGGYDYQRVAFSGTPADNNQVVTLFQTIPTANFSAGDVVEFLCDIDVEASTGAVYGPEVNVAVSGSLLEWAVGYQDPVTSKSPNPNVAVRGPYRSQPFVFTTVPSSLVMHIRVRGKSGSALAGAFSVSRVSLRKIIN